MTIEYDLWVKHDSDVKTALLIPKEVSEDMYIFIDMQHSYQEEVRYERLGRINEMMLLDMLRQHTERDFVLK